MNCPKCKNALKETAKFCTTCGYKIDMQTGYATKSLACSGCGAPLKEGAKFCTGCGKPTTQASVSSDAPVNNTVTNNTNKDSISVVKDRIFWNVQKGELAHRFNEATLIEYDGARGVIINEGSTAYIRANGELVGTISGGAYNFVEPEKLDKEIRERQGGIASGLRRGFRFISNLVLGTSVQDRVDNNNRNANRPATVEAVIENMKKNKIFSVTLKLDKKFPLFFEFKGIKTKIIDTTIGVQVFLSISDYRSFFDYYLGDSDRVTCERVRDELSPTIRDAIQKALYDAELTESKLPDFVLKQIESNIQLSASGLFYGLSLESIVSITSVSEDIERFRSLSRELYLSEQELDFLVRTNEFRNRLTLQKNAQLLNDASNDLDFRKKIQEINKDSLLTEDEMEKFSMLLSREKQLRVATNESEIRSALMDIEATGLLKVEDLENLKRSVRERSEDHNLKRFHSIELMQLNQVLEIDRTKLEWEYEIGDKKIQLELDRKRQQLQAEIGFSALDIELWKNKDNYKDSRFYADLQKAKEAQLQDIELSAKKRKTEIDLDNEEMDAQLERMRKLKEIEAAEVRKKHEHELQIRAQELSHQQALEAQRIKEVEIKYQGAKDLSAEQLMAIAANEKLDPIAAQKFAESFSAKHNAGAQKEVMEQFNRLNELRIEDIKQMTILNESKNETNADRLERLFNKMADTNAAMSGNMVQSKVNEKEEIQSRLQRTESRLDNTQDKALDYTTKNNSFGNQVPPNIPNQPFGGNTPPSPPVEYFISLPGFNNQAHSAEQIAAMIVRGQLQQNTSIWKSGTAGWAPIISFPEFGNLFGGNGGSSKRFCDICGTPNDKLNEYCIKCDNKFD